MKQDGRKESQGDSSVQSLTIFATYIRFKRRRRLYALNARGSIERR